MKSKKFVLAALALLAAITMVLLPLAGCKNDTVPPEVEKQEQGDGGGSETDKNNTAAKLVSITVIPPTRTVYSEGQEFDSTGMKVTATYDDKSQREVTGWETDFNTVVAEKGLNKPVTVSYTEEDTPKTTTFTVTVFPAEVEVLTDYESPNNTGNDCTYVAFGEWPQTEAVDFNPTTDPQSHGIFVDNYYVDGNDNYVKEGGKYYKVEPIVWRVLTTSYEAPEGGTVGEILLLAESILTGGIPYYVDIKQRTIGGQPVYANNWQYSTIRAWLNGFNVVKSDDVQENDTTYAGKGFLQTAFTADAQSLIAGTSVDNTAASTMDAGNNLPPATDYVCANTTDKVFLLSEEEATTGAHLKDKDKDITEDYGFDKYNKYVGDGTTLTSTRIRATTDYAKATGANQRDPSVGYGGWWWLRSPDCDFEDLARLISYSGYADRSDYVNDSNGGVVPALSISLQ